MFERNDIEIYEKQAIMNLNLSKYGKGRRQCV